MDDSKGCHESQDVNPVRSDTRHRGSWPPPWTLYSALTPALLAALLVWVAILHYQLGVITQRHSHCGLASRDKLHYPDVFATLASRCRFKRGSCNKQSSGEKTEKSKSNKCKKKKSRSENYHKDALKNMVEATASLHSATAILNQTMAHADRYHPSVHMSPVNGTQTVKYDALRWTLHLNTDHSTDSGGRYLGFTHFLEFDAQNQTLVVQRAGRYHVYAQLTFNGRQDVPDTTSDVDCSYEISLPRRVLLSSFTTQYRLGMRIPNAADEPLYAHDSRYVAGVFDLDAGDTVKVIASQQCDVRTEPMKTFFGMYLLSERK